MTPIPSALKSLLEAPILTDGFARITDEEFHAVRAMIYREAGISLSLTKRAMVSARLSKRLRTLRLSSIADYLHYLESQDADGSERQRMINCLTTNKTDFFRESHHFDYLRDHVFPQVKQRAANGGPRRLRIWSAGCSMGDEPYTIAMTILEHFGPVRGWDVRILASDINTDVLNTAEQGVYPLERIQDVSPELRQRYFLRGTGRWDGFCQVRPEVRKLVAFRRINFMDDVWPIQSQFDAIFCRNVIIYFDAPTQQILLPRLGEHLVDDGHLFLGHSENLYWLSDYFTARGNTVYQRRSGTRLPASLAATLPEPKQRTAHANPKQPKAASSNASPEPNAAPAVRIPRREIAAGEYHVSTEPAEISTTLGSCVAACLYDPRTGIGGMNHFILPWHALEPKTSARYGVHAMELLINDIMKRGGDRRRLQAKVFGGADILRFRNIRMNVGQRNAEFVREFLQLENIPITAERLGGNEPLRVHFFNHTGQVFVKPIKKTAAVAANEGNYLRKAMERFEHPATDNVTLF